MPPLLDLVNKYHLTPEVAFLVYRPILRLFKLSPQAKDSWPSSQAGDFNSTAQTALQPPTSSDPTEAGGVPGAEQGQGQGEGGARADAVPAAGRWKGGRQWGVVRVHRWHGGQMCWAQ